MRLYIKLKSQKIIVALAIENYYYGTSNLNFVTLNLRVNFMSLTSFLNLHDVKEKFEQEFQMPEFEYRREILAPPVLKNYMLVGTAFDYLLRFHIRYINQNFSAYHEIIESEWVAEQTLKRLRYLYLSDSITISGLKENDPGKPLHTDKVMLLRKVADVIFRAKLYADDYVRTGIISDELYECALILANLDEVVRSFAINHDFFSYDKKDVDELKHLYSVVNDDFFKAKYYCILNPSFGMASHLVGGAAADLIIDDTLIDIKTTKNLSFTRKYFNQLMGYYVLFKMRNSTIEGLEHKPWVKKLGVYYSRFGYLFTFPIKPIISSKALIEFQKCFRYRAKKEFSNSKNPV